LSADNEAKLYINNSFKEQLMENLAIMMVSAYYNVPWVALGEECGGMKEAYEWVIQQTFSDFSERALAKTTEGLKTAVMGEESESE